MPHYNILAYLGEEMLEDIEAPDVETAFQIAKDLIAEMYNSIDISESTTYTVLKDK
jgi:hypothetical protein